MQKNRTSIQLTVPAVTVPSVISGLRRYAKVALMPAQQSVATDTLARFTKLSTDKPARMRLSPDALKAIKMAISTEQEWMHDRPIQPGLTELKDRIVEHLAAFSGGLIPPQMRQFLRPRQVIQPVAPAQQVA